MSIIDTIAEGFKAFLISKVPMVPEHSTGQRVKYIAEPDIVPEHVGTVIRTWKDRLKVQWDGFETGQWIESEAVEAVTR